MLNDKLKKKLMSTPETINHDTLSDSTFNEAHTLTIHRTVRRK